MSEYRIIMSEALGPGLVRIDDDGITYGIPFSSENPDYQQYLIDTDGGLPIPQVGGE